MKITLYPYQPFEISADKITVFSTNAPSIYHKMISGLKESQDTVKVSDDNYDLLEIQKGILWGGEISDLDLNKLFQNRLIKMMVHDLTDEQRQNLNQLDSEICTILLDAAFMYDLPLCVDREWDMARMIKFFNLSFSNDLQNDPYGIIEGIVTTASELNETKVIVLMNVSHYLSINQFNELVRLMPTLNVKLFIIEFLENADPNKYQDCRYYHIDSDYVEWQYD